MKRYKIILPVTWYAFRPERLFVKQRVHEELPTAQAANSPAKPVASGKFHSGAHPTSVESTERYFGDLDKFAA